MENTFIGGIFEIVQIFYNTTSKENETFACSIIGNLNNGKSALDWAFVLM